MASLCIDLTCESIPALEHKKESSNCKKSATLAEHNRRLLKRQVASLEEEQAVAAKKARTVDPPKEKEVIVGLRIPTRPQRIVSRNDQRGEFAFGAVFSGNVEDVAKHLLNASAEELDKFESANPRFKQPIDMLWKLRCGKKFRDHKPSGEQTWRQVYQRALLEEEARMQATAKRIQAAAKERESSKKTTKVLTAPMETKCSAAVAKAESKSNAVRRRRPPFGEKEEYKPKSSTSSGFLMRKVKSQLKRRR